MNKIYVLIASGFILDIENPFPDRLFFPMAHEGAIYGKAAIKRCAITHVYGMTRPHPIRRKRENEVPGYEGRSCGAYSSFSIIIASSAA